MSNFNLFAATQAQRILRQLRIKKDGVLLTADSNDTFDLGVFNDPPPALGTIDDLGTATAGVPGLRFRDQGFVVVKNDGIFFWLEASTATVIPGMVEIPTGWVGAGRWVRHVDGSVSVRAFGAKGDGIADDGPSCRAGDVWSRANGIPLRWPKGVYRMVAITDTGILGGMHIKTGSSWIMEPGAIIKNAAGAIAWTRCVSAVNANNWHIKGVLTIDGSGGAIANLGPDGVTVATSTVGRGNEHMHGLFVYSCSGWTIDELNSYDARGDNLTIGALSEATISEKWGIEKIQAMRAGRKNVVFGTCAGNVGVAYLDNSGGGGIYYGGTALINAEDRHCLDVEPDAVTTIPQGVHIGKLRMRGSGFDVAIQGNTLAGAKLWELTGDSLELHWDGGAGGADGTVWTQLGGTVNFSTIHLHGISTIASTPGVLLQYGAVVKADTVIVNGSTAGVFFHVTGASAAGVWEHPEVDIERLVLQQSGAGLARIDSAVVRIGVLKLSGVPLLIRDTAPTDSGDDRCIVDIGRVETHGPCGGTYGIYIGELGSVDPIVSIGSAIGQGATKPVYGIYLDTGTVDSVSYDPSRIIGYANKVFGGLEGSATVDPVSVGAGLSVTATVAIVLAALGDRVSASFSIDLGGLILTAAVSAAGTVTATFSNPTAAAIDIGSGTLRVRCAKN